MKRNLSCCSSSVKQLCLGGRPLRSDLRLWKHPKLESDVFCFSWITSIRSSTDDQSRVSNRLSIIIGEAEGTYNLLVWQAVMNKPRFRCKLDNTSSCKHK